MRVQCQCGTNRYRLIGKPLCRFACHCRICQSYTGANYSDAMVALTRDVQLEEIGKTSFNRWRLPPNIQRGSCLQCSKPVIEYGLAGQLVFIPVPNVQEQDALPVLDLHLFYNLRNANAHDSVPKLSGYARSHLYLLRLIGQRMTGLG